MSLSAVAVITIIAACINGLAVASALRLMWGDEMRPHLSPARLPQRLAEDAATLNAMMRREAWVEMTTIDTPVIREHSPDRTPIPALSWGSAAEAITADLDREIRKAS